MVGYFLIILSFLAAVIGTTSATTRIIKVAMISVAALSACASAWMYYNSEQEKQLNKRLIASLVQATQEEKYFAEEIRSVANTVVRTDGHFVSSQLFTDRGLTIGFSSNEGKKHVGSVFFDQSDLREIRYALVAESGLQRQLIRVLKKDIWTSDMIEQDWNKIAPKIGWLAAQYMQDFVPDFIESNSLEFPEGNSVKVRAERASTQDAYVVTLSSAEIDQLVGLSPMDRGKRISEVVTEKLVSQF